MVWLTSSTLMLDFALVSKNLMPWSFANCQRRTQTWLQEIRIRIKTTSCFLSKLQSEYIEIMPSSNNHTLFHLSFLFIHIGLHDSAINLTSTHRSPNDTALLLLHNNTTNRVCIIYISVRVISPFLLFPWKLSALLQCRTYYLVTFDWLQLMHSGKEGMPLIDWTKLSPCLQECLLKKKNI